MMIDYDFSTLNDKEFENISIELISKDQGKRFERFKPGKDAGVDGRFYADDGKEEIVQCKHYLKTGYQGLMSKLKSEEQTKVSKLNPKKYFFATSLPLSRKNKKEIKEIFDPYIKNENDIYGQEDLNVLLKEYPDIEERHYKLWLSSTTVLKRILNNAIKGRSEYLLRDIEAKAKLYAMTKNHQKALTKLNESHTIIIAGEPGIGKTTLAEHLALTYVEKGFEFCVIENSLNEAEDVFDADKKQLFYFDDFLGSNYLEALEFHQDSHIVKLIGRVKREKNKRFILTSRTNIFNQGLLLSDAFMSNKISKDEFVIKVDTLSDIEKAMILYNHIWHSELDEKHIDELYKEKRYREIIKHKNFNPRLIEFVTDIDRLEAVSEREYWKFIKQKLANPADIWKHTFDQQSDEYIRNLVILMVFNGNKIEENEFKKAYDSINQRMKLQNYSYASKDFESVIKSVVKYFLNRARTYNKTIEYSLFNPSIADFIINRYKNNEQKLMQVFLSLQTLESLKVLISLQQNKIIKKQIFHRLIIALYDDLDLEIFGSQKHVDYIVELFYALTTENLATPIDENKIIIFYKNMIQAPQPFTLLDTFFEVLRSLIVNKKIEVNDYSFIVPIIENIDADIEEVNCIIDFLKYFDVDTKNYADVLNYQIEQYLVNQVDDILTTLDIDEVSFDHDYDGNIYLPENEIKIDNYLENFLTDVDEFSGILINRDSIKSCFDLDDIRERLVSSYNNSHEADGDYGRSDTSYVDDIDDLFER